MLLFASDQYCPTRSLQLDIYIYSSHSMLPFDSHSGWCDIQGRRSKIEDYHSIVFTEQYKFYSVLDGHTGSSAAKYTSRALHVNLELYLKAIDADTTATASIEYAVLQAFAKTQSDFLELYANATSASAISGTTATIALVYNDKLVVANVGDSRAVMCCDSTNNKVIEVTTDHTPYVEAERQRIEANGGKVTLKKHGVFRVEGQLAVTRRIGGFVNGSSHILTAVPDVHTYNISAAATDSCSTYQFVILSTDGLWDVVTSAEAVHIVQDVLANAVAHNVQYLQVYGDYSIEQAYQIAATVLTHLAYVRGSADNIGVCVISLK
jgi:serine/threonine protein phosphatase PrpC